MSISGLNNTSGIDEEKALSLANYMEMSENLRNHEERQALIEEGMPVEEVQKLCEIHVSAFEDALLKASGSEAGAHNLAGHPVDTYRKENLELEKILKRLGKEPGLFVF